MPGNERESALPSAAPTRQGRSRQTFTNPAPDVFDIAMTDQVSHTPAGCWSREKLAAEV